MLDRIVDLEPGVSARAERRVTTSAYGFPQMYLIECVAQLGGIAAAAHGQGEGGFLAAINKAEFGEMPCVGDGLSVTARILASFGRLVLMEGEVECEGRMLVRVRLSLGIGSL